MRRAFCSARDHGEPGGLRRRAHIPHVSEQIGNSSSHHSSSGSRSLCHTKGVSESSLVMSGGLYALPGLRLVME